MNKKYLTDITFQRCLRIAQGCSCFMICKQKIEILKNRINIVQLAVDSKKNTVRHEPLTVKHPHHDTSLTVQIQKCLQILLRLQYTNTNRQIIISNLWTRKSNILQEIKCILTPSNARRIWQKTFQQMPKSQSARILCVWLTASQAHAELEGLLLYAIIVALEIMFQVYKYSKFEFGPSFKWYTTCSKVDFIAQ